MKLQPDFILSHALAGEPGSVDRLLAFLDVLHAVPRLGNIEEKLVAIEGNVPGLYDMPTGCRFHPRCASFMAGACDVRMPHLNRVGETRCVECHLYD